MTFRDKLGTLRQLQRVLEEPGVLVVGSEVPNLLQPDAASTLVVLQDVDIAVPIDRVGVAQGASSRCSRPRAFCPRTLGVRPDIAGLDRGQLSGPDVPLRDASETYVLEDAELPLMVFGPLGLLRPGPVVEVEGFRLPLPRAAVLSLMERHAGMPDPVPVRRQVAHLLSAMEQPRG